MTDRFSRAPALFGGALAMTAVGSSVAVSGVLVDAPFWTAQALRYAAASLLLVVAARLAGQRVHRPRGAEWAWLTGVAVSGLVLFNVGLVRGAEHAEPAVIGVAVACVPVALALVGSRPSARVVTGAVVVTVGAVLVQGGGRTDAVGIGWAGLVLACEVGFTLLALPVLRRHGAFGLSVHTCAIAAVVFGGVGLVVEGPAAVAALRPVHIVASAHLAVVVTAVAFVLWYRCVGRVGAGNAGLLAGLAPVAAAAVGVVLGGPIPGIAVWSGVATVTIGLAVGLSDRTRSAHERPTRRANPQTRAGGADPPRECADSSRECADPPGELAARGRVSPHRDR